MKLYIKIDYKDRYEISGTIKNKTRKVEEEIFLFYKATRIDFVLFRLDIYASSKGEHLIYTLDERFDCSMTAKDICFFVENRIENIWGQLKPKKVSRYWVKIFKGAVMKERKVYVVKKPSGEYESYQEPIVKVFLDKKKAKEYVKEENAKLPLEQAKKCDECYFMWECAEQKGKERPSCFKGDKYNNCENYFKYHDIQELFIEEHSIDDIKTHDRELVKEVCEKIRKELDGDYNQYRINHILDQIQKLEGEDE